MPNRPEENKRAETKAETNLFKILKESAKFSSKLEEINEKVATYEKSLIQMREQEVPGTIKQFYQVAIDSCAAQLKKAVDLQKSMEYMPGFFRRTQKVFFERLASNIDDWAEDH